MCSVGSKCASIEYLADLVFYGLFFFKNSIVHFNCNGFSYGRILSPKHTSDFSLFTVMLLGILHIKTQ